MTRSPLAGKPRWLKVKAPFSSTLLEVRETLRRNRLHTVCESASCPNLGQCWHEGTATFMILGDICTRACAFCDVTTGRPGPIDPQEPERLARAVAEMRLRHVVITSVDRDDLSDGGAGQFAACVAALRRLTPTPSVEVLTPDFRGKAEALAQVLDARPTVFNHNVETVPRLYQQVRPAADYRFSLALLSQAGADKPPTTVTKSGIMLGLGESEPEVLAVLADLRTAGVALLTIGQYLRPSLKHHPVIRYWTPEAFEILKHRALSMGFKKVASHPLARSSFHAEALLQDR